MLRLGSQCLRCPWMRQILYHSQIYYVMPWPLMTWTDSLFCSGFGSFTYLDSTTCFPTCGLSTWITAFLPPSPCELFDSWLLPVGIPSFVLFLGSSNCMLLTLLVRRLASLSWLLILTCPIMGSQPKPLPGHNVPSQLFLHKWPKPFLKHCCGW